MKTGDGGSKPDPSAPPYSRSRSMRYSHEYRDPEAARAYFARARSRRSAGDYDGAWQDFSEGLRLDPECFTGWSSRAYLLYDLGLWQEAAADFRRAVDTRCRGYADY